MELEFPPIAIGSVRFSCCYDVPGPAELGAVNPYAVHDHGQPARQRDDAARAQAKLDADNAAPEKQQQSENEILTSAPAADDGPVPKVLLDAWARERRRWMG